MLTALSLGLRPRELGQLSTIIPHNHGITFTYTHLQHNFLCVNKNLGTISEADLSVYA